MNRCNQEQSTLQTGTIRSCLEELAAQGKLVSADEPKLQWLIGMQYHRPALRMLHLIENVGLAERPAKIMPAREAKGLTFPASIMAIGSDGDSYPLFEIEEGKNA